MVATTKPASASSRIAQLQEILRQRKISAAAEKAFDLRYAPHHGAVLYPLRTSAGDIVEGLLRRKYLLQTAPGVPKYNLTATWTRPNNEPYGYVFPSDLDQHINSADGELWWVTEFDALALYSQGILNVAARATGETTLPAPCDFNFFDGMGVRRLFYPADLDSVGWRAAAMWRDWIASMQSVLTQPLEFVPLRLPGEMQSKLDVGKFIIDFSDGNLSVALKALPRIEDLPETKIPAQSGQLRLPPTPPIPQDNWTAWVEAMVAKAGWPTDGKQHVRCPLGDRSEYHVNGDQHPSFRISLSSGHPEPVCSCRIPGSKTGLDGRERFELLAEAINFPSFKEWIARQTRSPRSDSQPSQPSLAADQTKNTLPANRDYAAVSDSMLVERVKNLLIGRSDEEERYFVNMPMRVLHRYGALMRYPLVGKMIMVVAGSGFGKTTFMWHLMREGCRQFRHQDWLWDSPEWTPEEMLMLDYRRAGICTDDEYIAHLAFNEEAARAVPQSERTGKLLPPEKVARIGRLLDVMTTQWPGRCWFIHEKHRGSFEDRLRFYDETIERFKYETGSHILNVVVDYAQLFNRGRDSQIWSNLEYAFAMPLKDWAAHRRLLVWVVAQARRTEARKLDQEEGLGREAADSLSDRPFNGVIGLVPQVDDKGNVRPMMGISIIKNSRGRTNLGGANGGLLKVPYDWSRALFSDCEYTAAHAAQERYTQQPVDLG